MNLVCLAYTLACLIQLGATQSKHDAWVKPLSKKQEQRLKRSGNNAAYYSGQTEGDMVLSPEQIAMLYEGTDDEPQNRNGQRDKERYRWPGGLVPYQTAWQFDSRQLKMISDAAKKIEEVSCVRFIQYDSWKHKDYITVDKTTPGCWAEVGRLGGEQFINLGSPGCFTLYDVVHNWLHALGFFHMHTAPNRDRYIQIIYTEIIEEFVSEFKKTKSRDVTSFDVEYDYGSVMHFASYMYAIGDKDTIVPLEELEDGVWMGQRERLSPKDIQKINRMYCENFWRDPEAETDEDIEYAEEDEDELEDDGGESENDEDYSDDELDEDDYGDEDGDDLGGDKVNQLKTKKTKNDLESNASPNAEAT